MNIYAEWHEVLEIGTTFEENKINRSCDFSFDFSFILKWNKVNMVNISDM